MFSDLNFSACVENLVQLIRQETLLWKLTHARIDYEENEVDPNIVTKIILPYFHFVPCLNDLYKK